MKESQLFVLGLCFALGGCITSGDSLERSEGSPQEAAQINYELGSQYLRQDRLKLARERLERATEQDPNLPGPHMALAIIYERTGDTARADTAYRRALKVAPDDANAQNSYAVFLCNRGDFTDGQKYFLKAAVNPENRAPEVAYANAGVCALEQPDPAAAETHFRKALKRDPKFPDALLHLSSIEYQQENYLAARAFMERYTADNKATAEVLFLAVRIEKALGNRSAMLQYAKRLKSDFPDSVQARKLNSTLNAS